MQWDENEGDSPFGELTPVGWSAPRHVVARHVQDTLQEAVRIANQTLDTPSEQAVMQLFQAMFDRTSFEDHESGALLH